MQWDDSDDDIKEKYDIITNELQTNRIRTHDLKKLQDAILSLKMVEMITYDTEGQQIISYICPPDHSLNMMTDKNREDEKILLLENIDSML